MGFSKKSVSVIYNFLLLFIVVSSGVTNIYFVGGLVIFSMIPFFVFGVFFVLMNRPGVVLSQFRYSTQDYMLLGFFAFLTLSFVANPNSKSLTYTAVYLYSFIGLGIFLRNIFINYGQWRTLNTANLVAVTIFATFCSLEFVYEFLNNKPSEYIHDLQYLVPRPSPWNLQGYCGPLPRVFGFAMEPTYLGWYFNTLGVLAIVFLWRELRLAIWQKALISALSVNAYVLTWSTSSWILLAVGLTAGLMTHLFFARPKPVTFLNLCKIGAAQMLRPAVLVAPAVFLLTFWTIIASSPRNLQEELAICATGLADKAAFAQPDTVASSSTTQVDEAVARQADTPAVNLETKNFTRMRIWQDDLNAITKAPLLGRGVGFLSSHGRSSSLNLFIFVAYEMGIPAAIFLMLYFAVAGCQIIRHPSPYQWAFVAVFVAGTLHLLTMTQHFYFNLWVAIAFFYLHKGATAKQ